MEPDAAQKLLTLGLEDAMLMTLLGRPISNRGENLAAAVADLVLKQEQGKRRSRGEKTDEFRSAISAIVIDLLNASARTVELPENHPTAPGATAPGWAYHGRNTAFFQQVDHDVSKRLFGQCIEALHGAGLIEYTPGISFQSSFTSKDGRPHEEHKASRYRATDALVAIAAEHGLTPGNYRKHFKYRMPRTVVELREPSRWMDHPKGGRKKEKGKRIPLTVTPEIEALSALIREINERLALVEIDGGYHWAFRLIFNDGQKDRIVFIRGGRLYSSGPDSYQQDSKAKRLAMTMDGEPVCEIDIASSHQTILWGLFGDMFPASRAEAWSEPDLYSLPGIDHRGVGKAWFTLAMGLHRDPDKWSPARVTDFREETGKELKAYSVSEIGRLMRRKHPVIGYWLHLPDKNSKDLQYIEAQIILRTMLRLLREHDIPAFPVFDSLIVKLRDVETVAGILKAEFEAVAGIVPRLKINPPPGHTVAIDVETVKPIPKEQPE